MNGMRDNPVTRAFQHVRAEICEQPVRGAVADYIPELANADPELFGISAASIAGHTYEAGDSAAHFTIQSISKPFLYALVLAERGVDAVWEHVGVEPSGEPFNAISFDGRGRPSNPMINAGAIVTTSLVPADDAEQRFARIRDGLSAFAGRSLELDEEVYRSESDTGDRNRALAMLARSTGVLACDVEDAVEPYFRQCALLVNTIDLAVMGATLANNGMNPVTGVEVVPEDVARLTLSVMTSCGMYDRSGDWIYTVGMPAKSGVGGGIVAVAPGQYGIGVFSPPLNDAGNSSRGVEALRKLSRGFGLHLFTHPGRPASPIQSVETEGSTLTFRLRGELDFVSTELVVHESLALAQERGVKDLVYDLSSVTTITPVARYVLRDLTGDVVQAGYRVTRIDPLGALSSEE